MTVPVFLCRFCIGITVGRRRRFCFARRPQKALATSEPLVVGSPPGLCEKGPKDFSLDGFDRQYRADCVRCTSTAGGLVVVVVKRRSKMRITVVDHVQEAVQGSTVPYQAVLQPKGIPSFAQGQMLLESSHHGLGKGIIEGILVFFLFYNMLVLAFYYAVMVVVRTRSQDRTIGRGHQLVQVLAIILGRVAFRVVPMLLTGGGAVAVVSVLEWCGR